MDKEIEEIESISEKLQLGTATRGEAWKALVFLNTHSLLIEDLNQFEKNLFAGVFYADERIKQLETELEEANQRLNKASKWGY